jgi:hypothetical protein
LTFGLAAWLFLILAGCAHNPDSSNSIPKQPEVAGAQAPAAPQEAAATVSAGPPAVELSETLFNFGRVTEGNDYVHAFTIRNTGTGILTIRKIMPG